MEEIVGFSDQIFRIITVFNKKKEIVFLEGSCGKAYLTFALNYLLKKFYIEKNCFFYSIDSNSSIIDECNRIKLILKYDNIDFVKERTIRFEPKKEVDIVVGLHACDSATDEIIAKGIKCNAKFIIVVPCCQNQIRTELGEDQPLKFLTEFGLLRYRFSNLLTDGIRSQFLEYCGYTVELKEIVPKKVTPKNLIIIARRKKRKKENPVNKFEVLKDMFNVQPKILEYFPEYFQKL